MIQAALCKAAFVLASFTVLAELGQYFQEPVAPDERHLREPVSHGRFDPTMAPDSMAEDCRREGKQLFAWRAPSGWEYGCVKADLRR